MQLFDSHCHLDDRLYDTDYEAMLERARANGIQAMMIVGITVGSSQKAVALAGAQPGLFASVGIHPHDAKSASKKDLEDLAALANAPRVRAWGEIGLDFNRMFSPQPVQEEWFVRQLLLADALELPVIFHERESQGRLLELLSDHPCARRKGVIHCFSGTRDELAAYIALGFHIGITGIITHKTRGADLRRLLPEIPRDRLLIETDAPYLTPAPERNRVRRNEPAFLRSTFQRAADVLGADSRNLAQTLWENTCALFKIDPDDVS